MTGIKSFLSNIKPYLKALLVDGLTPNLISTSQLYDLNLSVNFTRDECVVTKKNKMS